MGQQACLRANPAAAAPCSHSAGALCVVMVAAVLKGIQKGINLPPEKMIPSFAGLREYGNTSCSTTWQVSHLLGERF